MSDSLENFTNRLLKRKRHLAKWARKRGYEAYRVYDRDIAEFPFSVDVYKDRILVNEYLNPTVVSRKNYPAWREQVLEIIQQTLEAEPEKFYIKQRDKQKESIEKLDTTGNQFPVREGNLQFLVNLNDYLDTGLFLDHRPTREIVGKQAQGKRVLNLFCYTGSFTVYAASGGAAETVSVDTSAVYLDWLVKNLEINGLHHGRHRTTRQDVRSFLQDYKGEKFDLIVCDPPVFSKGKKLIRDFDVLRDHPQLLDSCMKILRPGGTIYFSTNFRKFSIRWEKGKVENITEKSIPDDFQNKRIHTCYKITPKT